MCAVYILILGNYHSESLLANSIQVCGASREQWETTGSEEQGKVQDHELESERRNGICSWDGILSAPVIWFLLLILH